MNLPFSRREIDFEALRPHFHSSRANLCLDCEQLYEMDGGSCPACGSMAAMRLSLMRGFSGHKEATNEPAL